MFLIDKNGGSRRDWMTSFCVASQLYVLVGGDIFGKLRYGYPPIMIFYIFFCVMCCIIYTQDLS